VVNPSMADPFMLELFRSEVETHARALESGLAAGASVAPALLPPLIEAAQAIRGVSKIVGLEGVAGLAEAIRQALESAHKGNRQLTPQDRATLEEPIRFLLEIAALPAEQIPGAMAGRAPEVQALAERLAAARAPGTAEPGPAAAPKPAAPPVVSLADVSMLDLFHCELENHARLLEEGLLKAEGEASPSAIEPLMRAAHSIKGAARMVGLDLAVSLAHAMEDLLSATQHGKLRLAREHIDGLLRANDLFLGLAKESAASIPERLQKREPEIAVLSQSIRAMLDGSSTPPASPAQPPPPVKTSEPARALETRTEEASVRVFAGNLQRLSASAGECLVEIASLGTLGATVQRIKERQNALGSILERVLEAIGNEEWVEAKSHIEEARRGLEALQGIMPGHLAEFDRFSRRMEQVANKLYEESVASRMRPFSDGLHGFPRMVRDFARQFGKSVAFEIRGETTRVDREILEKLEAPLNHLLRNALDHGLEPPAERIEAGKPEQGTLILQARHVAGSLEIVVQDNGRGIDLEWLRSKVAAKGYVTPEIVAKLSESEVLDFLFLPGFSTSDGVTEVSGRGVGLDVVLSMVRQVGGHIRILTEPGKGASFILRLPLSLSVLRVLLVEIDNELYAIPLLRIDRVFRLSPSEIEILEDKQFFRRGNASIGLVDARQVLEISGARTANDLSVVVLSDRLNQFGLVVDALKGQCDLVVTPLHKRLGNVPGLSAAALLKDGTPVLILDTEDIVRSIDRILTHGALRRVSQAESVQRRARKRVLVVDDSLTVREVERQLLERRGYEVTVAVDGADGWNTMQGGDFALVVTDIDMPRLNGIELVRRMKSVGHTAQIPVMIVSYKDAEKYREEGLKAGASRYLTKSSFHDDTLVSAVEELIGAPV
jgi:two-component system, chemotaxis family, sensor histidine kinase and response regulator WspE